MPEFDVYRQSAVRYWERRRIIYNLALFPPSIAAYVLGAGILSAGDSMDLHPYFVLMLFIFSALGANVCYTFAYALEFIFWNADPTSRWHRFGRPFAFASGVALAMLFAVIGGRNIAVLEYQF